MVAVGTACAGGPAYAGRRKVDPRRSSSSPSSGASAGDCRIVSLRIITNSTELIVAVIEWSKSGIWLYWLLQPKDDAKSDQTKRKHGTEEQERRSNGLAAEHEEANKAHETSGERQPLPTAQAWCAQCEDAKPDKANQQEQQPKDDEEKQALAILYERPR